MMLGMHPKLILKIASSVGSSLDVKMHHYGSAAAAFLILTQPNHTSLYVTSLVLIRTSLLKRYHLLKALLKFNEPAVPVYIYFMQVDQSIQKVFSTPSYIKGTNHIHISESVIYPRRNTT